MTKETIQLIERARRMSHSDWEKLKEELLKQAEASETETRIYTLLKELGVPSSIKGYNYIKRAVMLSIENPKMLDSIVNGLFTTIAKEYDSTYSRVERAIRHAIEVAYERGNMEKFQEVFQYICNPKKGKPTNSEFIAGIVEYIQRS